MLSEAPARIGRVRVGVVDIGSNTARLLVADVHDDGELVEIARRRAYLGLGAEIASTGTLTPSTVARTATIAGVYADRARASAAATVTAVITAPGRQARCGPALASAVAGAVGATAQILDADDEGRLAFEGAVARRDEPLPQVVGVVDVGGGSTEVVVGTPLAGPAWVRSLDLGSLRLRSLALDGDPPSSKRVERARRLVAEALGELEPPKPDLVLAVGGSARGVARVVGSVFGHDDLQEVVRIASAWPALKLERTFHLHPHRARTLLAGALLLEGVSGTLGRALELGRGGVREGVALRLARRLAATA